MSDPPMGRPARWVYVALAALLLAGVGVRFVCIRMGPEPFLPDAIYYADVAENMATGRGCVIDYAWIYVRGVPASFPTPAMGYWMPGMSFYLVPWIWVFGPTGFAVRLANVCMAIPFTLLCWWLGRAISGREGPGLLAAGLAAIDPHLMAASTNADASLPQGVFSCGAMLCMYYGLTRNPKWIGLAGLLAGLSHFMRNDGVLTVLVMGLLVIAAIRGGLYRFRPVHLLFFFIPYVVCVAPWMVRNAVVFGSPSPPGLSRLLILPNYEAIFRTDITSITVGEWLAARGGWLGVFLHDLRALWHILRWLALEAGGVYLIPAGLFLWVRRTSLARPYLYFAAVLVLVYSFALPEVGKQGAFVRSFYGWQPLLLALAAGGVWMVGEWLAPKLRVARPRLVLALLIVLLAAHTADRLGMGIIAQRKGLDTEPYYGNAAGIRAFFSKGDPSEAIFTNGPWGLHQLTGRPCYMLPPDGMDTLYEMAARHRIRYIATPAVYRRHYPGMAEAIRDRTLHEAIKFPTLAPYQGLQVYDLWMTLGRRENDLGAEAARAGDYDAALDHFTRAADYVADDPDKSRMVAENLVRIYTALGEQFEDEGESGAARRMYINASHAAPEGMDLTDLRERVDRLGDGHGSMPHGGPR